MSVARRIAVAARGGLIATLLATRNASASVDDPGRLRAALGLADEPSCAVCHASTDAGPGLAPFGEALVAHTFVDGAPDSLEAALSRMRGDHVDTDGDGATDLDELSWGGDPNHADLPENPPPPVERYGCALARNGHGAPTGAPIGAFTLAALAVGRRKPRS